MLLCGIVSGIEKKKKIVLSEFAFYSIVTVCMAAMGCSRLIPTSKLVSRYTTRWNTDIREKKNNGKLTTGL